MKKSLPYPRLPIISQDHYRSPILANQQSNIPYICTFPFEVKVVLNSSDVICSTFCIKQCYGKLHNCNSPIKFIFHLELATAFLWILVLVCYLRQHWVRASFVILRKQYLADQHQPNYIAFKCNFTLYFV